MRFIWYFFQPSIQGHHDDLHEAAASAAAAAADAVAAAAAAVCVSRMRRSHERRALGTLLFFIVRPAPASTDGQL